MTNYQHIQTYKDSSELIANLKSVQIEHSCHQQKKKRGGGCFSMQLDFIKTNRPEEIQKDPTELFCFLW